MMQKNKIFLSCALLFTMNSIFAWVHDSSRWAPCLGKSLPWIPVDGKNSHTSAQLFFVTANRAIDHDQEDTGIAEIYGKYDQGGLARSFVAAGCPNPLKSEWQGGIIPWFITGKIEGQGIEIAYQQHLMNNFSLGFDTFFMRLNSWQEFCLEQTGVAGINLRPSDIIELDDSRRCMHSDIGLCGDHARQGGIGDIDFYARFGKDWDHVWKCRTIIAALRLGVFIPTAEKHDWHYASWVSFGGNKHWGLYARGHAEFELKEDLRIGFLAQISKRQARTYSRRLPRLEEPEIFGVLMAPVNVNPGLTFSFTPYISLEGLRGGLGLRAFYTITKHRKDSIDYCGKDESCCPNIARVERYSEWASDYFSLNVFYDFGKVRLCTVANPILTLTWDIPAAVWIADRVGRTNKISVGLEVAF